MLSQSLSDSEQQQLTADIARFADLIVCGKMSQKQLFHDIGQAVRTRGSQPVEVVINKGPGCLSLSSEFISWYRKTVGPATAADFRSVTRQSLAGYMADFGKAMLVQHSLIDLVATAQPYFTDHYQQSMELLAKKLGNQVPIYTKLRQHIQDDTMSDVAGLPHREVLILYRLYSEELRVHTASTSSDNSTVESGSLITTATYKEFGLHFLNSYKNSKFAIVSVDSLHHYTAVDCSNSVGAVYYADDLATAETAWIPATEPCYEDSGVN